MQAASASLRSLFAAHGLKVTHQRTAIYEALTRMGGHPTVDELYQLVKADSPRLSLATLYNVLELFAHNGLAYRVAPGQGAQRYEAAVEQHYHALCQESGTLIDFRDDALEAALKAHFASHPIPNFDVSDIQLVVLGRTRGKQLTEQTQQKEKH